MTEDKMTTPTGFSRIVTYVRAGSTVRAWLCTWRGGSWFRVELPMRREALMRLGFLKECGYARRPAPWHTAESCQ